MKFNNKILLIALGAFLISVAAVIYFGTQIEKEYFALNNETDSLKVQLEERDSAYNEVIEIMFSIEKQIARIKERENLVSNSINKEIGDYQDVLSNDIDLIDSLIVATSNRVSSLNRQLGKAQFNLKSFKQRIINLTADLNQSKSLMDSLKHTIAQQSDSIEILETKVGSQEEQLIAQHVTIEAQAQSLDLHKKKLNTAFYTIGTEKELLNEGVIVKQGGILGLGKTMDVNEDVDLQIFRKIDTRSIAHFPIEARDIKIVSEHPSDAYQLIRDGNKVKYLDIKDPKKFWELSKYLVVVING